MLEIIGSVEHRSIQGLMYAVYVLTAGEGNKPVSAGVNGGIIGSASGPVKVLVASSPFFARSAK